MKKSLTAAERGALKKLALKMDPSLVYVNVRAYVINKPTDFAVVDTDCGKVVGIRTNPDSKGRTYKFQAFTPANKEMAIHCRNVLDQLIKELGME